MNRFLYTLALSTSLFSLATNVCSAMPGSSDGESERKSPPRLTSQTQFTFTVEDPNPARKLLTDQEIRRVQRVFSSLRESLQPLVNFIQAYHTFNKSGVSLPSNFSAFVEKVFTACTYANGVMQDLTTIEAKALRAAQTNRYLAIQDNVSPEAKTIATEMAKYTTTADSKFQTGKTKLLSELSAVDPDNNLSYVERALRSIDTISLTSNQQAQQHLTSLRQALATVNTMRNQNVLEGAFSEYEAAYPKLRNLLKYSPVYAKRHPLSTQGSLDPLRISNLTSGLITYPYQGIISWLEEFRFGIETVGEIHQETRNPYKRRRIFTANSLEVAVEDGEALNDEGKRAGRLQQNDESTLVTLQNTFEKWAALSLATRRERIEGIPSHNGAYARYAAQESANQLFSSSMSKSRELLGVFVTELKNFIDAESANLEQRTQGASKEYQATLTPQTSYLFRYRNALDTLEALAGQRYEDVVAKYEEDKKLLWGAATLSDEFLSRRGEIEQLLSEKEHPERPRRHTDAVEMRQPHLQVASQMLVTDRRPRSATRIPLATESSSMAPEKSATLKTPKSEGSLERRSPGQQSNSEHQMRQLSAELNERFKKRPSAAR